MSCDQPAELFAVRAAHLAGCTSPRTPAEALLRHVCPCSGLPHLLPSLSACAKETPHGTGLGLSPQWVNSNLLSFSRAAGYGTVHPTVLSQQVQDACASPLDTHATTNQLEQKAPSEKKWLLPCFLLSNLPSSSPQFTLFPTFNCWAGNTSPSNHCSRSVP